jgi:hypothetical protein
VNKKGYKIKITNARVTYEKELADLKAVRDQMLDSYEDVIDMTVQECDAWHNKLNRITHKIHAMRANIKAYKWKC